MSDYWNRKNLTRRRILAGAAGVGVGATALGLVGCGDDSTSTPTAAPKGGSTPAGSASAAASPAASPSAAPTKVDLTKLSDDDFFKAIPQLPVKDWKDSDIKMGGRVVRASNRPIQHFDFATTVTGFIWDPTASMFNRLVRNNAGQDIKSPVTQELEGDLAQKWERPDAATLLFTLQPNIKWHNVAPLNGRALVADDVKFSIDRLKTFAQSIYKGQAAIFDTAEAVGTNQVRLKLNGAQPFAENFLALVWMSILSPEIGSNPDLVKTKPIGTGSMMFDNYNTNVELVLKKNPDYFKKDAQGRQKPYVDGLTITYAADPTSIAGQFAVGNVDFLWAEVNAIGAAPFDQIRDFNKRLPNAVLQRAPNAGTSQALMGQWTHPAFKDERFRRALSMLVPREQLAKAFYKGLANFSPYFPWSVLSPDSPPVSKLGPYYQFNPSEAKKLLDASGTLGSSYDLEWYEAGKNQDVLTALQDEAGKVGLKINLVKSSDQAAHFTKVATRNWKDLILDGRPLDFLDPAATIVTWVKGQDRNRQNVDDPVFNDLYAKLLPATGDARKQVSQQIFDRVLDQVYDVPLPVSDSLSAWHPRLKNWVDGTWWSSRANGLGQIDSVWLDPTAKM